MKTFSEERNFWLGELKKMGVQAPAKMYPSRVHDDDKDNMIDRMKSHLIMLAETQNYQKENGEK